MTGVQTCALPISFPRTDPVIITLITKGERCLLGRQAQWPPGMYSAIAGFVEPGETLEGAVRREAREETGIEVGAVRYVASQPWPFPASIMLGFAADALTTAIARIRSEAEDAVRGGAVHLILSDENVGPGRAPKIGRAHV